MSVKKNYQLNLVIKKADEEVEDFLKLEIIKNDSKKVKHLLTLRKTYWDSSAGYNEVSFELDLQDLNSIKNWLNLTLPA